MRTCASCGRQNADDQDFCACGEYLRWDPTSFVRAVPAPTAQEPPTEPLAEPGTAPTAAPSPAGGRAGPPPPSGQAASHGSAPPIAPDAVALTLRLPDTAFADDGGAVTASLEPGGRAVLRALVRNQGAIVDNYDVSVVGLPDGWWSVSPPTLYLVPMGTGGTYEQEVEVRIHPPRTADAEARTWPFDVVIGSRAHQAQAAAAPANAEIAPYTDVRTGVTPDRRKGRRRAEFVFTAENRANAPVTIECSATDADGECRFHFAQAALTVAPGERVEVPLVVAPPKPMWIGRPVDRRFEATARSPGAELALLPQTGTYRQRPWVPVWVATVLPLVVLALVLFLVLAPKKVTVPDLTKATSRFAAQQQLVKAQLAPVPIVDNVTGGGRPGAIIAQTPAAGAKVKKGTPVTIQVVVGSGLVTTPSIVGMKVQAAAAALDAAGLKLGEMLPPPPDPEATVGSQIPPAGKPVHPGDAVAVFVVHGAAAGQSTGATGTTAAGGGGGAAAATGKPIPVPDVAGKSVADAAAALAQAQLLPVETQRYDAAKPGTLVRTEPAAGAPAPPGSKVKLIVSAGFPLVLFDGTTGLMSVGGAGGQPVQLAGTRAGDTEPSWSADGTHIAYVSGNDVVLAVPGKPSTPLLRGTAGAAFRDPVFAPAGKVLAAVRRTGADGDLCLADAGAGGGAKPDCIAEPGTDVGRSLSWSADGRQILVAGHPKDKTDVFGLVLYQSSVPFSPKAADWGKGTVVTDASRPGTGALAGAFSPDGKQLAVASNVGGTGFQLYVTTPDDFKLQKATPFAVAACAVAWRPDGLELALVTNPGCREANAGQIARFDPQHPDRVVPLVASGAHPAWQPLRAGG